MRSDDMHTHASAYLHGTKVVFNDQMVELSLLASMYKY